MSQACIDCHGTKVYQPLIGQAEPCQRCGGSGKEPVSSISEMSGYSGEFSTSLSAARFIMKRNFLGGDACAHLMGIRPISRDFKSIPFSEAVLEYFKTSAVLAFVPAVLCEEVMNMLGQNIRNFNGNAYSIKSWDVQQVKVASWHLVMKKASFVKYNKSFDEHINFKVWNNGNNHTITPLHVMLYVGAAHRFVNSENLFKSDWAFCNNVDLKRTHFRVAIRFDDASGEPDFFCADKHQLIPDLTGLATEISIDMNHKIT